MPETLLPSDFEERKLRLEERRFEEEVNFNKRKYELEEKALKKADPLVLAVVGGLMAAFASVGVSYLNGRNQIVAEENQHSLDMTTEAYRAEANRILETVKLGDPDRSACTLKFLMKGGLIQTQSLKDFVDVYLASRNGGSGIGNPTAQPNATAQAVPSTQPKVDDEVRTSGCQPVPNSARNPNAAANTSTATPPSNSASAQIVTYSTGWMGGGHNQNEACEAGIRQYQPQFPNKVLSRVSSDEESKKDFLGHVEYKYYCTISVK
jgi:type II secretory pathway pseudopilin PulG